MKYKLDEFFIWYCCVIGTIGNLYTCMRIAKKIVLLKKESNKQSFNENNQQQLSKFDASNSFDRKHNLTIFYYFFGINLNDLIVLLNWIIAMINVQIKLDKSVLFETNMSNTHVKEAELFLDLDEL
jgi:hypothetical protein